MGHNKNTGAPGRSNKTLIVAIIVAVAVLATVLTVALVTKKRTAETTTTPSTAELQTAFRKYVDYLIEGGVSTTSEIASNSDSASESSAPEDTFPSTLHTSSSSWRVYVQTDPNYFKALEEYYQSFVTLFAQTQDYASIKTQVNEYPDYLAAISEYRQLNDKIEENKNIYINSGEDATKKVVEDLPDPDFSTITGAFMSYLSEFYQSEINLLKVADENNCIAEQEVDDTCLVRLALRNRAFATQLSDYQTLRSKLLSVASDLFTSLENATRFIADKLWEEAS